MQIENESHLIQLIKKQDVNAFKKLCQIYYEQLYQFLWRKTRNDEVSKDLVQELFLNIWKLRLRLDESKSFKAYLYKAANNLASNYFKQKNIQNTYNIEDAINENSISVYNSQSFQEYLDDVLQRFPEEQRLVFMLNKFEGFKYVEIANILNISIKTVESRMSKILKVLREEMKNNIIKID